LAIVHVAMKSSSKAPPAAAHADYIARDGKYEKRGGVELLEFGNMPAFAQDDPRAFWVAADAHERANGRTYTELQIALPRELDKDQRLELARAAAREFLGDRFAYTLAVHQPLAKDNIEQPHMHLMFSERAIDATTRALPEEQFFKRNGAKKDPAWNDRNKPEEIRAQWCAMMNRKMAEVGIELEVDPRSWADQGREDLAELREPKMLGGQGEEAVALGEQIDELRELRRELPAPFLGHAAAVEHLERKEAEQIAEVEERLERELGLIEKLMTEARKLAVEAAEKARKATEAVRDFLVGVERFRKKADVEIAAEAKARQLEESTRPRGEPSRAELDRQLREIARSRAVLPNQEIQSVELASHRKITGRVLGYTQGGEEALFQRLGGELYRLDMRGKPRIAVDREIDYDRKTQDISQRRGGMSR
jgi:MobA/MobL family